MMCCEFLSMKCTLQPLRFVSVGFLLFQGVSPHSKGYGLMDVEANVFQ